MSNLDLVIFDVAVEFVASFLNSRSSVAGINTAAPAGARRHTAQLCSGAKSSKLAQFEYRSASIITAVEPSSAALSYHCRARAISGSMPPMMPIRRTTSGSNVVPRTKAASAFPAAAARRSNSRAEATSPLMKTSLPNLSSIAISSLVSFAASSEAAPGS
jgi:hypothetical protein